MSQSAQVNKSLASKDTDFITSVSSRLRSNRTTQETGTDTARDTTVSNRVSHNLNASTDASETAKSTPSCMTRQRAGVVIPLPLPSVSNAEQVAHKDSAGSPQSATTAERICLCQPEPKIPRPRNAFILYRQHNQSNITHNHPSINNPEISKIAGKLWKEEPEDVKAIWKGLAEEEKQRHAQQYPDYRFAPRHRKDKSSPTTTSGYRFQCEKCGGLSNALTTPPSSTPVSAHPSSRHGARSSQSKVFSPDTTRESMKSPASRPQQMMINTSDPYHADPRYVAASSPQRRKFPDSAGELADPKRRRFDGYPQPATTRPEHLRMGPVTSYHSSPGTHHAYPSPRSADPRRGSLLSGQDASYYSARPSVARPMDSPPPFTPHSSAPGIGPHSARVTSMVAGRTPGLHGYPATPTSAAHHGQAFPYHLARPSTDSETLRLAPMVSPSAKDASSRSVEAMIRSVPLLTRISSIRRVAPPLRDSSIASPVHKIRGSIVAVEGSDVASAEILRQQLGSILERNDEFDIRVLPSPEPPGPRPNYGDYHRLLNDWVSESQKMIDFVTGKEYERLEDADAHTATAAHAPSAVSSEDVMDTDLEDGEVAEGPGRPSSSSHSAHEPARSSELEKKKADMAASIERESRRQSAVQAHAAKIPLLIVSNYMLQTSTAWAVALPIEDAYSPVDHWIWTATMWRGIVGPDLTVYVRSMDKDREPEPMEAPPPPPPQSQQQQQQQQQQAPISAVTAASANLLAPGLASERKVEMREEIGTIVVKKENGKVEDGSVRRVAFEIGEWVRQKAGKLS